MKLLVEDAEWLLNAKELTVSTAILSPSNAGEGLVASATEDLLRTVDFVFERFKSQNMLISL